MFYVYFTLQSVVASTKKRLSREESGATAVEYGLLVGLIAVVIIAALLLLGPKLADLFTGVSESIPTVPAPATP